MDTTIAKAERFTHYLKRHQRQSDELIDPILDKLIERERQLLLKQRIALRSELDQFEQQYQLPSSEFYEKFQRGKMGDDMDFVDWAGTWRVYQTILESLATLDPVLP